LIEVCFILDEVAGGLGLLRELGVDVSDLLLNLLLGDVNELLVRLFQDFLDELVALEDQALVQLIALN
jgi:hypothetical protein